MMPLGVLERRTLDYDVNLFSDEDATAHLNAMNQMGPNPWPLSFSYGRAMQQAALKLWSEDMTGNWDKAQATVYDRAKANGLAALGQWERSA